MAGKGGSLTLRPLLRAVQPLMVGFVAFGGLGHSPSLKQAFMAYLWRLCDAKLMRSGNGANFFNRRSFSKVLHDLHVLRLK